MPTLPEDKLDALTKRFDSIEAALSAGPSPEAFVKLSKEYAELEPLVRPIQGYRKLVADLEAAERGRIPFMRNDVQVEAALLHPIHGQGNPIDGD